MHNKDIAKLLKLAGSLLELHEANEFKIRSYQATAYHLERLQQPVAGLDQATISELPGIGKGIASKIIEISQQHTFAELQDLLDKTPAGVQEMLHLKGIGPKKVRSLWKELHIESLESLLAACYAGNVARLKGFGEAIQEEIIADIEFKNECVGTWHFAEAEAVAIEIEALFKKQLPNLALTLVGEVARCCEVVHQIEFIGTAITPAQLFEPLQTLKNFSHNVKASSPFIWVGTVSNIAIPIVVKWYPEQTLASQIYMHNAAPAHLATIVADKTTLLTHLKNHSFESETAIFKALNWQPIPPEMREGIGEVALAQAHSLPNPLTDADLIGILHNHTTYSDGTNSLEEMVVACKNLGYQYLGISDHSQSATYANGLNPERIEMQQREIDLLNKKYAPFKVFKGVESDILGDGSLDYPPDVLQTFDFIVASIHSNLKMDIHKATERLIKAIENPYTTMLGHPTGRLLLNRRGYPINHKKVIDACAANKVIIEINADPWRLDLDWTWLPYATDRGVLISINPDAHETDGYVNMRYGVCVARKGRLTAAQTFNALPAEVVEAYFKSRKPVL